MKIKLSILFFLFITSLKSYSQTKKNTRVSSKQSLEINRCDEDNDGFYSFEIKDLEDFVLRNIGNQNNDLQEEILISTKFNDILSIKNPSYSVEVIEECNLSGSGFFDIGINSKKEVFTCGGNFLKIDEDCKQTIIPFEGYQSNALSFDDFDRAYIGFGNSSQVINFEIINNEIKNIKLWHDFNTGFSGGDFVILKDKMYVAWSLSDDDFRLYEVTVDEKRDYVSHIDLGKLPRNTYGLASEFGKLYGVTPQNLFKINLTEPISFQTIVTNKEPQNEWWGATGKHEAISLNVSSHISIKDAENNTDAIIGTWTNTIRNGQTIFIRIENSLTGSYEIVNLDINIYNYPQVNLPKDLVICVEDSFEIFDLNKVVDQMQIPNSSNLSFKFYDRNPNSLNNPIPIGRYYESFMPEQNIYVDVDNGNCNSLFNFKVINNKKPRVTELSDAFSPIFLDICDFDSNGFGYFDLNHSKEKLILEEGNFSLRFFVSLLDAENNINEISNIFYLKNELQEIFVRVINEKGCFRITNIFLSDQCLKEENPFLYIEFPKFFTPNNDGKNDYWTMSGGAKKIRENAVIEIFDRYGKKLFSFSPEKNKGWDGTYRGNPVPESDYWFLFKTINGVFKSGNISLIK